jgi:hypothetical protein
MRPVLVVSLAFLAWGAGCGGTGIRADGDGGRNGDGGSGDGGNGDGGGCVGLACFQVSCTGGGTTSLSGIVNAPNGTLPLPHVKVYVPNGAVPALADGVQCERCSAAPVGLVSTETDAMGRFTLGNVPATQDVPLVIQVGHWRRQITVPSVTACVDTPLDAGQMRLPKNKSEGDIPQMALTTGGADALECLLRKIGLDDAEFTTAQGTGRVHLYAGSGGTDQFTSSLNGGADLASATTLWGTVDSLGRYQIVFFSCEGGQHEETKPAAAIAAVSAYTDLGGRVFASHWHNYWLQEGWPATVTLDFQADLNNITADVDTTFEDGAELAQWLVNVQASTTLGKIDITAAQHTVTGVDQSLARRWIYKDQTANGTPSVQYLSFTTPLTAAEDQRCGKVVFSDIHVSSSDSSGPGDPFPEGCTTTTLSPQEKVLAFMVFDIAGCVEPGID